MEGKRILIVDDEDSVRLTLAANLELEGFEILEAVDGQNALEVLGNEQVDLILSDIRMPQLGGVDLLRRVKELDQPVPVVLMTAYFYDKDHVIKRSRLEGLENVLFKKPVDPDRLKETILKLCKP